MSAHLCSFVPDTQPTGPWVAAILFGVELVSVWCSSNGDGSEAVEQVAVAGL